MIEISVVRIFLYCIENYNIWPLEYLSLMFCWQVHVATMLNCHYNNHEWHVKIFEYSTDMAKYAGVVKEYSTMLEMFIKEYSCDSKNIM